MKQQQGAALVIVMALLAGALMLGMSGMQSALIDERLAGNYRASVQAQMTAESTSSSLADFQNSERRSEYLSSLFNDDEFAAIGDIKSLRGRELEELLDVDALDDFFKQLLPSNYEELSQEEQTEVRNALMKNFVLEFERLEKDKIAISAQDDGLRRSARGQSRLIYAFGEGNSGSPAPFQHSIVGCEGVSSGGGSTISSYRSSEGDWSGQPGSFSENDIPLIRTTSDNANVVLGGNEKIHGGIEALGSVTLSGSSQVFGSIMANRTIYLNAGGGRVRGDAESLSDVIFGSSTRVDGNVRAMGDVRLSNWSASVGEGIYAGGEIISQRTPASDHIDDINRANFSQRSDITLNRAEEQPCDTADFAGNSLNEEISRYQETLTSLGDITVGAYPNVEWRFTPEKMERYDQTWNVNRWINHASPELNTLFGEQAIIYRTNNLTLTSSPSLRVSGGDVVIVVDGNFTMGGGGPGLVIDADSSLTVFVTGKTDFGSVLNMPAANSVNSNGKATFSLFSGYSGSDTGVSFSSSNRVVANVYAPYANVSVNSGSGFFGSVKGRSVSVSGSGSIVYDELLVGTFGEPSNGAPDGGDGSGWRLMGWQ
ncbi:MULTISPECIES: PilX N-terminal domain-containing pilus assembly protein [unclassified Halomonas]|uniref:DUF7305 domain-containing protein n=1 Tax=unclassified Halomonas TaxID=2609666 RepID=UPI001CF41751|nr:MULTISPECIES: hypothetical protein [unclassified Halomonas]MCA8866752.1 hypothetical protein [Halomonas sp. SBBP1]UZH09217.1 hypothetical protein OM794_18030 [Halomonas sp. BDJS001]